MNREAERKRLVELLKHECDVDGRYDGEGNCPGCKYNGMEDCSLQELADHLLDNGIVVPPCKVGDKVYVVVKRYRMPKGVYRCIVKNIIVTEKGIFVTTEIHSYGEIPVFEEDVFTSREEAEKMLKGKEDEG